MIQDDRQIGLELDLEINKDFEKKTHHIRKEQYQKYIKGQISHKLVDSPELLDLVNTERIVQKYLPKQT